MTAKFGFQVTVNDRTIWLFPEDVDAALTSARAQANAAETSASAQVKALASAGIAYSWTRGPGEDPIRLGSLNDLVGFIQNNIIAPLPDDIMKPTFDVQVKFKSLIQGLPDPINGMAENFTQNVYIEIDSMRLKIPGKSPTPPTSQTAPKPEGFKFEIAILISFVDANLKIGPFQLNRVYAKLGNFEPDNTVVKTITKT